LVVAILNANYEMAAFLLQRGADPNVSEPRGSALHVLAWMRRADNRSLANVLPRTQTGKLSSLQLAALLLQHGAKPNALIEWEDPPVGASNPRGGVTGPADIALGPHEGPSFVGATPFWIAAYNVDVEMMRLLAYHGGDPLIATRQRVTPLMAPQVSPTAKANNPVPRARPLRR